MFNFLHNQKEDALKHEIFFNMYSSWICWSRATRPTWATTWPTGSGTWWWPGELWLLDTMLTSDWWWPGWTGMSSSTRAARSPTLTSPTPSFSGGVLSSTVFPKTITKSKICTLQCSTWSCRVFSSRASRSWVSTCRQTRGRRCVSIYCDIHV